MKEFPNDRLIKRYKKKTPEEKTIEAMKERMEKFCNLESRILIRTIRDKYTKTNPEYLQNASQKDEFEREVLLAVFKDVNNDWMDKGERNRLTELIYKILNGTWEKEIPMGGIDNSLPNGDR